MSVLRQGPATLGIRAIRPRGGRGGRLHLVCDSIGDSHGLPETGNINMWKALALVGLGEGVGERRPKAQLVMARTEGWRCCR